MSWLHIIWDWYDKRFPSRLKSSIREFHELQDRSLLTLFAGDGDTEEGDERHDGQDRENDAYDQEELQSL